MQQSELPVLRRRDPWVWLPPLTAMAAMGAVLLAHLDTPLFLAVNRLATLDPALWSSVTLLGDGLVALALVLPLQQRHPEAVWAALLAMLIAALLVHGVKHLWVLPRPPAVLPEGSFHLVGPGHRMGSFPSGHTATIFTLLGMWALCLRPRGRIPVTAAAIAGTLAVAWSRSVVGVHWPVDILAGSALGWTAAVAGVLWARRWGWGASPAGRRWVHWFLLLCAAWLLVAHDTGYPQGRPFQHLIALIGLTLACYGPPPAHLSPRGCPAR